jgi:hypothetical protein
MKFFITLSLAAVAIAQTNSSTGVLGGIISPTPVGVVSNAGWAFSGVGPGMAGRGVTGVPYSAEQVTEHVQTLADGTRITQPSQKVMLYRDSQGRTRTERTFPQPAGTGVVGPSIIEIADAASGTFYNLDPRSRIARKMSVPAAPPPLPPPPPGSGIGSPSRVNRVASPTVIATPSISGPDGQTQRPQFSRESLGTQTIEGILAEGSRTTVVYPIGAFGNDRPITTVSESWMSPELKMVVLSKNSDPRSGETTTRLTNISRAEPDPSLFQIPSDYEVIDSQAASPRR